MNAHTSPTFRQKKTPRAKFTRDVGVGTRLQCPANKKALKSALEFEDFVVRTAVTSS
jgi:hypothetical protein